MDDDITYLVREEYINFTSGKPQGERLMTVFYRDVVKNHVMQEVRELEMHEVFHALMTDPRRESNEHHS